MSFEDTQNVKVKAPAVERAGAERIRVLAVDDSSFSRKLLEHALRGQPYELAFAKDGKEALASIVGFRPKIIITDCMLPALSGPELCRRLSGDSSAGYTCVILLTRNLEKEHINEGLAAGA